MPLQISQPPAQSSARELVGGILDDVQVLAEQKVDLARREIEVGIEQRVRAAAVIGSGALIVLTGVVLMCLAAAHLLHGAVNAPGAELARFPLWASHAVVGVTVSAAGVIPTLIGRRMLATPIETPTTRR